jgi:type III pantothenate kinase
MGAEVVVDIGNTRMKWGLVRDGAVVETVALGRYPSREWQDQFDAWQLSDNLSWLIASVDRARTDDFVRWVSERSQSCDVLASFRQIPIRMEVESPSGVGIDRLLACVGALGLGLFPPPFLVVQVGTALVVNFISAEGVFIGGSILPGFALMAKALNQHTAQLPEVSLEAMANMLPGKNTNDAIQLGMLVAALGTVRTLRETGGDPLPVYLTGGDAAILHPHLTEPVVLVNDLVLEGMRIVAEKMP